MIKKELKNEYIGMRISKRKKDLWEKKAVSLGFKSMTDFIEYQIDESIKG